MAGEKPGMRPHVSISMPYLSRLDYASITLARDERVIKFSSIAPIWPCRSGYTTGSTLRSRATQSRARLTEHKRFDNTVRERDACSRPEGSAEAARNGIAAGLVLTLALNKILARWAEGSSRDPLVLLAVMILLSLVAAVACIGPARRAVNVDPMTALRYE